MKISVLDLRLAALADMPGADRPALDALGRFLRTARPAKLFRFTLRCLDESCSIEEGSLVNIVLLAVRAELLVMEWCLVCSQCTGIIHSEHRFSGFEGSTVLCPFCNRDVSPDFQENVEVAFSPHPSLGVRRNDPCKTLDSYQDYFFMRSYHNGGLKRYLSSGLLSWYVEVKRDCGVSIPFDQREGSEYNLFSIDSHFLFRIRCSAEKNVQERQGEGVRGRVELVFTGEHPRPIMVEVTPGTGDLLLLNRSGRTIGAALLFCGEWSRFETVFAEFPIGSKRRLMGSRLLLHPQFVKLFGNQSQTENFSFQMGCLSVLFTDLTGSTALYSSLGDLAAYRVVGKHFDLLEDIVCEHHGAVIKTIGDALMAVFNEKEDSLHAALSMHRIMAEVSSRGDLPELSLKIGIHHGMVLAVNANQRLDYFGQTVNIAARVQSEAGPGEICVSESFSEDALCGMLREALWECESTRLKLRGVGGETLVHRWRRGTPGAQ